MNKLVPVEPTEAMIEAAISLGYLTRDAKEIYAAMLAAYPPSGGEPFAWCYTVGKKREVHFRRFEDDEIVDDCTVTPLYTCPMVVDVELALLVKRIEQYLLQNGVGKSPALAYAINKAKAALREGK